MKKKMLAVLLAGTMVASLTACGGSNPRSFMGLRREA